jgi:type I restriction enzyme S subunit
MKAWASVRLGEVLRRSGETVDLAPDSEYREITVRLWGKGVIQRAHPLAVTSPGIKRFVAHADQLILSRIDARSGAIGLVPTALDGAVVSNDFPLFDLDRQRIVPGYVGWLAKTRRFVELCRQASEGTTNRVRLQVDRFLALEIPLPSLAEQRQLVSRVEELVSKIAGAQDLRKAVEYDEHQMLLQVFSQAVKDAPRLPMSEVAPVVRRAVPLREEAEYPELGIRSFGRGTFHKPPISGMSVGSKRLFEIHPGDLLFSNVFAWEGAVAVAASTDVGRYGSHRFITCVPRVGQSSAHFLCFHFLTETGLHQLRSVSPGSAGRNRTLSVAGLRKIEVPVPPLEVQTWFDEIQIRVNERRRLQAEVASELESLVPALLDRTFRCEQT